MTLLGGVARRKPRILQEVSWHTEADQSLSFVGENCLLISYLFWAEIQPSREKSQLAFLAPQHLSDSSPHQGLAPLTFL